MKKKRFTELEKKENRTDMLTARIRPSIMQLLKKARRRTNRSYADIIEHILINYYGKGKNEKNRGRR